MSEPKLPSVVSKCDDFFTPHKASPDRVARAQKLLAGRKARTTFFSHMLFGEPAWDVLLYLYIADKCVCTAELPAKLGKPHSIIRRWIAVLEHEGLVGRSTHPDLPFTIALDLTEEGYRLMNEYLDGLSETPC